MRRRVTLLVVTALTAAAMALGPAGAAFADSPACRAQEKANWECKGSTLQNGGGHDKGKFPGK